MTWGAKGAATALTLVAIAASCAATPSVVDGTWPAADDREATRDPPVSEIGSDQSELPARYPNGSWVPMVSALFSLQIEVPTTVNGAPIVATIDTGASSTVISSASLLAAGVKLEPAADARTITIVDAHGDTVEAYVHIARSIILGDYEFEHQRVLIVDRDVDLFLIGADMLSKVDLYLAADEGLIGIFDAGRAPVPPGAHPVSVVDRGRQLRVVAQAAGARSWARFPLIVDTGASSTTIPLRPALKARIKTNVTRQEKSAAVGGVRERRGFFALDALHLETSSAPVVVPRVYAPGAHFAKGESVGLLGNDVLLRHRTVIQWSQGALYLAPLPPRSAQRHRGPGGRACSDEQGRRVACIDVAIAPKMKGDDACLRVRIHPAYAGTTLEMAITVDDGSAPYFAGGALRAFFTVSDRGVDECVSSVPAKSVRSTPRLLWVRNEGVQWLCDPMATTCTDVSGPLASLPEYQTGG